MGLDVDGGDNMKISNYIFEGPYDHKRGFTDVISAVYAIIDSRINGNSLVDVGQTEDLNNRFPNHPRELSWNNVRIGTLSLWILRVQNERDRLAIESQIRTQYNPPCGER